MQSAYSELIAGVAGKERIAALRLPVVYVGFGLDPLI